ncbi:hypothetical protein Daura_51005 [Dactylosporangium aurantiacum]|uniref:Uncharacterized protein n=1 Tax=Dactylosporangium aurantiacum TaxID=35754 RepID=A0A9Q9MFN6_9ACTN|nr:hypothetical protein [Dactylosporangium aurantiacum]MDG6110149.1 hypothetical protein [Dactylosporangium aurantiacum]UWZ54654.1 hypothetical protein Daura_51005 [Dactylosporangium aurantiacum]
MTQPDEDLLTFDDRLDPDVRDPEAPPADAAEQALPTDPLDRGPAVNRAHPWDANEYDAVEQDREVAMDDEYR